MQPLTEGPAIELDHCSFFPTSLLLKSAADIIAHLWKDDKVVSNDSAETRQTSDLSRPIWGLVLQ